MTSRQIELTPRARTYLRWRLQFMQWRRDLYCSIGYSLPAKGLAGNFRAALLATAARLENAVDSCRHIVGRCVDCERILLVGDSGYAHLDRDPICCAACAPTWEEMKSMIAEVDSWEDEESRTHALKWMDSAIAGGASWSDRATHPL